LVFKRSLNEGFSGGEKKRSELFQLSVLKPKLAILDEIDSGLDVDSQKMIAKKIDDLVNSGVGILFITHNPRILRFLKPANIYVMVKGQIAASGNGSIAKKIELEGFKSWQTS